jgi:hypothetical protein
MRVLVLIGCVVVGVACWDRVVAPEGPTYPPVFDIGPVKVDFCSDSIPTWFAYKDGDSAWKTMIPDPMGTVEFTPTTNKIGIAFVQDGASSTTRRTTVWFVSSLEARHLTGANCVEGNGPVSLTATVAGLDSGIIEISIADSSRSNQTSLSFTGLPSRKVDVIASTSQKIEIRRDITPVSGTALAQFNVASAAFVPLVQLTAVADFAGLSFLSRNGTTHALSAFVPPSLLQIGDLHRMSFAASVQCIAAPCTNVGGRFAERYMYQGSATGVPLGAHLSSDPTVTVASTTPYLQARLQLPPQPDYATGVALTVSNTTAFPGRPYMRVVWTSAYIGLPGSWDLTFPDLSGIAGWQPEYGIPYVASDGSGPHTFAHLMAFAGRYPRPLPIAPHAGDALRWVEYSKPIP